MGMKISVADLVLPSASNIQKAKLGNCTAEND
nr:hypothetical protein [Sicyoidochytrium minutum DNA virus]